MISLLPPVQDPTYTKHPHFQIHFLHPAYDDTPRLFTLWATDEDTDGRCGLYARFALDACSIVTGNRHNGWLSTYQDIHAAVKNPVDSDQLLYERNYYYHLDPEPNDEPYKVVPHFGEWKFPHQSVPEHWEAMAQLRTAPTSSFSQSNLSEALRVQDKYCTMSRCWEKMQAPHIVPQSEYDWFFRNAMGSYNNNPTIAGMDDVANALLLRADLHLAFDDPKFVFVPKGNVDDAQLVIHLLDASEEYVDLYHNRPLSLPSKSIEMLYARLAWTIFQLLGSFLQARVPRRLALAVETSAADEQGYVSAADCIQFAAYTTKNGSRKRNNRKCTAPSPQENEEVDAHEEADECEGTIPRRIYGSKKRRISDRPPPPSPCTRHATSQPTTTGEPSLPSDSSNSFSSSVRSTSTTSHPPSSQPQPSEPKRKQPVDINNLRDQALAREKVRSDPQNGFTEELAFAKEVWDGRAMDADEVERFFRACGCDFRDDEGLGRDEHIEDKE